MKIACGKLDPDDQNFWTGVLQVNGHHPDCLDARSLLKYFRCQCEDARFCRLFIFQESEDRQKFPTKRHTGCISDLFQNIPSQQFSISSERQRNIFHTSLMQREIDFNPFQLLPPKCLFILSVWAECERNGPQGQSSTKGNTQIKTAL